MTHIAFIVPDHSLVKVVHDAWALHEKLFGKNPELRYTVDCEIQPDVIVSRHYDADVIVSRGGTAASLKTRNVLTPVVAIWRPPSGMPWRGTGNCRWAWWAPSTPSAACIS